MEQQIVNTFKRVFPHSYINVSKYTFGDGRYIRFALGRDATEWANGYIDNDTCHIAFSLEADVAHPAQLGYHTLEAIYKSFMIKPTNPYMYCGRQTVPYRKISGANAKVLQYLNKFLLNLERALIDAYHKDILLPDHRDLVQAKLDARYGAGKW